MFFQERHGYRIPETGWSSAVCSSGRVSWIIFSVYIASAVAQPVMGKCSDLFGRRKIFLIGLVVVFVSSMLAPLSPGFSWLIVFRIVQSVGTSMMVAVGMAIVRIHVTEKQAAALSVLAMFLSGAAAVGPFIGGVLIHWWDWPSIFPVNFPFSCEVHTSESPSRFGSSF
ncbi:MFS transporter, partial [Paenibacillus sp. 28ISP30-2]|nr:MFS transporter [Paenibacillus sp. 28ISP30-2]